MKTLNATLTHPKDRPVKVVQFGQGNFLRGFVDYMIDIANEKELFDGSVVLIKSTKRGTLQSFHEQDCQYTVSLRGLTHGKPQVFHRQITCVKDAVNSYTEYDKYKNLAAIDTLRFVVSNTTEAGIVFDANDRFDDAPAKTFPGKLTQFLYHRFKIFQGNPEKGLIMLPVELIEDNGMVLKHCVLQFIDLWNLGEDFKFWVENACIFTSTLVDRIITGYPKENEQEEWNALGYEDRLMVMGEPFGLWVIESPKDIRKELPLSEASLPVIFTSDQKPYKQRKVRILNGAHTSFVLASYLCGNEMVKESMEDEDIRNFINHTLFEEVIPTLSLPLQDLKDFADAVIDRFCNPYIKHALLAISLNSVSKWRARCLPSLLDYFEKYGKLPIRLTFSLAALMAFYEGDEIKDGTLIGYRNGEEYPIIDDMAVLEFFKDNCRKETSEFVTAFLKREDFFGQDLTKLEGLTDRITVYLEDIKKNGMRSALCRLS